MTQLDMAYVQSQFPGLTQDWVFFDNAGGAQIAQPALDRMVEFLTHRKRPDRGQLCGVAGRGRGADGGPSRRGDAGQCCPPRGDHLRPVHHGADGQPDAGHAPPVRAGDEVIVTMADHESNIGPWTRLEEFGVVIKVWPLNADTMDLQLADLAPLMTDRTRLVCVTHVSNILGQVHPVADFARFVHDRGARICVDAVAYAPHG